MDNLIEEPKLHFPPITFHRLLVIEWLGDDDQKTGTELVRYLSHQKLDFPVDLISCRSRDDVFDGIARATDDVPKRGIPLLHIEAHGYEVYGEGMGFRGPNPGSDKPDVIRWEELEEPFRSLNYATALNLIVVAAACLSDTALYAVKHDRLAPFALLMALSTRIAWIRLENAMKAFYCAFLQGNGDFWSAYLAAKNQISSEEKLGFTPIVRLVRDVVHATVSLQASQEKFERIWTIGNALKSYNQEPFLSRPDALRQLEAATMNGVGRMVSTMLGYDLFPNGRDRFKLDGREEVLRVFRNRDWSV